MSYVRAQARTITQRELDALIRRANAAESAQGRLMVVLRAVAAALEAGHPGDAEALALAALEEETTHA